MECQDYSSGSKTYSYKLLRKRPLLLRVDSSPILITATIIWYNFGSKIFDREELIPVLSLMAAITFHSLLFFVNFWSADANLVIGYSQLAADDVKNCTHVWVKVVNKKQDTVKRAICEIILTAHEIQPGNLQTVYSLEYMKKRMLWHQKNVTFSSIPYPTKDDIQTY